MTVEIGAALRYENLLKEALRLGPSPEAAKHLAEARALIPAVRPEDDPTRSEADREAWRLARGA